ncbi:hypothetical protein [Planomonospora algeriensis]
MHRVLRPARHPEIDLGDRAHAVLPQELPQALLHHGGQRPRAEARGELGGGGAQEQAAAGASRRIRAARCHRARSISVVTLRGRPRSTVGNSPGWARSPSSRTARPNMANPASGPGATSGTSRNVHRLRISSARSRRWSAVASGGEARCARRADSVARACRCAVSGRSSARTARGRTRWRPPTRSTRRRAGRADRWVTPNRGSAARARRTTADLASITSSTQGRRARPTRLRTIPVTSRKSRPPASAKFGAPACGSATG